MTGIVRVKDLSGAWVDVAGGLGPTGPTGPAGPMGATGPTGRMTDLEDVHIGTAPPTVDTVTLWWDPDDNTIATIQPIPGGTIDQALIRVADDGEDVAWAGPHLKLAGGTVTGDLAVNRDAGTAGTLTSPVVAGPVNFRQNISANRVTNRTNTYTWTRWDPVPNLASEFSDSTAQSSTVERSPYLVVVSVTLHKTGVKPADVWVPVLANPMPLEYRPAHDLWTVRTGTEELSDPGSIFETRVTTDGHLWVSELSDTLDWKDNTYVPIHFTYPAAYPMP